MVPVDTISFANWLEAPVNRTAFRHARKVMPVADIANDAALVTPLQKVAGEGSSLSFLSSEGKTCTIAEFQERTYSDGLLILRDGEIAYEWYTDGQSENDQHIVFSVTKSVTGTLAGILIDKGLLSASALVPDYVPEIGESGFVGASVQQLLDMTVSLDFEEAYLDPESAYTHYRRSTGWLEAISDQDPGDMHSFFSRIPEDGQPHGERFDYLSPVSDLLGWVCERAGGASLASLISDHIWKPIGAQSSASITLDRLGAPRAAGGLSCTLRDMARMGECMRLGGRVGDRQVFPASFVKDTEENGDPSAFEKGSLGHWMPGGGYRNQWWITNDERGAYFASGIYGQWIYIAPKRGVVIAKQASRPVGPANKAGFRFELEALGSLADSVA